VRFYDIVITEPTSGAVLQRFTNKVNGQVDMGALDIELDISTAGQALPISTSSFLRIWGISLQQVGQATSLVGKSIAVYGGMQAGLPLAKPAQSGLIVSGTIYPAYGNWVGTSMTLDMQIVPYLYAGLRTPVNIAFNWPAGTTLASALTGAFSIAFPQWKVQMAISPNLVQNHDEPGFYGNLQQLAEYVKQKSIAIIGGDSYNGVEIGASANTLVVTDGTQDASATKTQVAFEDLIGQPTWIGLYECQIKTAMRADIAFGSVITLPPLVATLTGDAVAPPATIPSSSSPSGLQSRQNSSFQGDFRVVRLRHVGRLRQPDAFSWNTTFDLVATPTQPFPANAGPPIGNGKVTLGEPYVIPQ